MDEADKKEGLKLLYESSPTNYIKLAKTPQDIFDHLDPLTRVFVSLAWQMRDAGILPGEDNG